MNFKNIIRIILPFCIFLSILLYSGRADSVLLFTIEYTLASMAIFLIKRKFISNILWGIYLSILGVQAASLFSSGQYLMPLALSNAAEVESLGIGEVIKVFSIFILFVIVSFVTMPSGALVGRIKYYKFSFFCIVLLLVCSFISTGPVYAFYETAKLYYLQQTFKPSEKIGDAGKSFLKTSVFITPLQNNNNFKGHNVIVIFAEGFSSEIIGNSKMAHFPITPNLDKLSTEALSFKNYYNHTAATFRGLRGQLTSGYQFRDGLTDAGTGIAQLSNVEINNIYLHRQTSLPDILKEYGYKSYFIASTEKNSPLNTMLKTLNFDKVLGMGDFIGYQRDRMTDKQTFNALQYFLRSQENKNERFFIGVYPSGTHHGQDSPNEKYFDGSNPLYNKFYNYDFQLGKFVDFFRRSSFYGNTLLIITSDHSTFPSTEYKKSFNSDSRYFVDKIPFLIIGKNITPEVLDAGGENSLSFAPTILHMLGIQYSMNYFLGGSLLDKTCTSPFSHLSAIGSDYFNIGKENHVELIQNNSGNELIKLAERFYNISG
ncbi:LTA synthase family protein [Escherichia coli]|uniref:LTA synthase family protein n=1 Tax=Escherichia coli TaxID=562 RepID=UPI001FF5791F|nr:sulfatase-like hydrolase/transferase [Escherichia coli]MCZ5206454.1 sulfatase-like hydrolase/transferase [Escherichia coli]MCZ5310367.1 sulfatase-like hydrolase/transferase [Escherichia coli]MCZ5545878.1 sulfatase-like hydrolase/transferase [Escherichia coli]MCZ6016711.1 sulfatase-like hydrolase/transferase [Escherichia coli]WJL92631.1 sulfatase-like hydrolase/transferase [Escherichia coli O2:K1:H5]